METLSGVFLGVGCRTFHDPVAEVLELLCGIEAADNAFGELFGRVKAILTADRRGAAAEMLTMPGDNYTNMTLNERNWLSGSPPNKRN